MVSTGVAVSAFGALGLYGLYTYWRLQLLKIASRECRRVGPLWLGRLAAGFMHKMASLNGVKVVSFSGEGLTSPSRQYIYVWHPHGFISYVPAFFMGAYAIEGRPHNREWFGTAIPLLFKLPLLGEIFQLTNARPVDRKTLEAILEKGGSLAIQPGGVREQAASKHDQEQAFFPAKLGFIRLAIKYGTPLMPMYLFGENQLYRRVNGFEWLTKLIKMFTGMTVPIVTAKFGLPLAGLNPIATDVHVRWGKPVEVGERDDNPSDERVEALYKVYVASLEELFKEHAKDCLPPAIAEKGLNVIRVEDRSTTSESAKKK